MNNFKVDGLTRALTRQLSTNTSTSTSTSTNTSTTSTSTSTSTSTNTSTSTGKPPHGNRNQSVYRLLFFAGLLLLVLSFKVGWLGGWPCWLADCLLDWWAGACGHVDRWQRERQVGSRETDSARKRYRSRDRYGDGGRNRDGDRDSDYVCVSVCTF